MKLDNSLCLIIFRFSFTNDNIIPHFIHHFPLEMPREREAKKKYLEDGKLIVAPVEKCSLIPFAQDIEQEGYELVDAFYRPRIVNEIELKGRSLPSSKRLYRVLCFTFAQHKFERLSDEFKQFKESLFFDFLKICRQAFWRTQAYKAPYFEDDKPSNCFVVTINLSARVPRFYPDGRLITQWQKDEFGERVGDFPLPLTPNYYLGCNDGEICFRQDFPFENPW